MDLICLRTIDAKQGALRAIRFNVDGSYCLTSGADKKIKLWNPHRNLMLKIYGGHGNEVLDAVGSCDSSQIVSCGTDKSVILWDVSTGQPLRRFRGHAGTVCCVKFNEESSVAISGSHDNTVMCWDLRSRKNEPIQVMSDAKDCITSVQVTNYEIMSSSVDCHTRLYDLRVGQMTSDFIGDAITYASLTHDGQCTVVSCSDDKIRLMDKSTGELLSTYTGYSSKDYSLENCVSNTDTHVLSGSATGEIWCWDLITANVTAKYIHTPNSVVHSLSMHPSQNMFLSASGGNFKVWGLVPEESEDVELVQ